LKETNADLVAQLKSQQEQMKAQQKVMAEDTNARIDALTKQQEAMMQMFQNLFTQGAVTLAPAPNAFKHRKKKRTSGHDGGPSESSDGDSDTPMNHES
jgi:hypothetical protein